MPGVETSRAGLLGANLVADGGALTAPDNAVFDPINNIWIGENVGIPPDIEVEQDAQAVAQGRDPQLERAVQEALRLLSATPARTVTHLRSRRLREDREGDYSNRSRTRLDLSLAGMEILSLEELSQFVRGLS